MSTYTASLGEISSLDTNMHIAFVVGNFNAHYTHKLEQINRDFLSEKGFKNIDSFFVPGAFEIPGYTKKLIEKNTYDIIITLGVVIRGETPHFDYVCGESARGIMDLNIRYNTPIIFGILTCNNEKQVEERMNSGFSVSALNLLVELNKIA